MSIENYNDYDGTILEWSRGMEPWRGIVYGLCTCLRTAPIYSKFALDHGWGDIDAISMSHDLMAGHIGGKQSGSDIDECIERLERALPDTEDFEDALSACETCAIHLYAMGLLKSHEAQSVYYIARSCYEMVDAMVGELIMPDGGIMTRAVEQMIVAHPLIQAELQLQTSMRSALLRVPLGDAPAAHEFIQTWRHEILIR